MNKDEALKCLSIAQRHRDSNNLPSAIRFTQKSINLCSTPEAEKLLAGLLEAQSSGSSSSGAQPNSSTAAQRGAPKAPSTPIPAEPEREFTAVQAGYVKRIRGCKPTDYYGILGLEKTCEDADIKKAYRKQAVQVHPDRNSAPGAKQAFQLLSDAFQKLDDPQSRAAFDRYGADSDVRGGGSGFSGFGGGGGGGRQTQQYQGGDLSPEDLFNMFFGGGGAGGFQGGFQGGGGPIFTASFGPNGFQRASSRRTNAANAANDTSEPRSLLVQLMPLILLFGFSMLSSLPNLFAETPVANPRWAWTPSGQYNVQRATAVDGARYYVNPAEWNAHPSIQADLAAGKAINDGAGDKIRGQRKSLSPNVSSTPVADELIPRGGGRSHGALSKFDAAVDTAWRSEIYSKCQHAMDSQQRRRDAEIGVFAWGTNWDKVKEIEKEKPESCDELRRLGLMR